MTKPAREPNAAVDSIIVHLINEPESKLTHNPIPMDVSSTVDSSTLDDINDGPQDVQTRVLNRLRGIPAAGIVLGALSGIFFATAGFVVKMVPNVNPVEIVVTRSLVQLVVYLSVIILFRINPTGVKGERVHLFLRGFFGFLAFGMSYIAYRMISLADASTIIFSAPVYVSIFACLMLKEECGPFQFFTITITVVGVALISKPDFIFGYIYPDEPAIEGVQRLEGSLVALFSSLCAAFTFVVIRKLQKSPTPVVIFWFSCISIICGMGCLALLSTVLKGHVGDLSNGIGIPETWNEIGWLVINGACGVFGQLMLTIALKIEEAGLVSLARTVDILMAFVFQILFLDNEKIAWTSILGACIVCSGVCLSTLRRWLRDQPGKWNLFWLLINCGTPREPKIQLRPPRPEASVTDLKPLNVRNQVNKNVGSTG